MRFEGFVAFVDAAQSGEIFDAGGDQLRMISFIGEALQFINKIFDLEL